MRESFWPTMRRPASSITALTLPVRLRWVASGLMIEKVRSAMGRSVQKDCGFEGRGLIAARSPPAKATCPPHASDHRPDLHLLGPALLRGRQRRPARSEE